MSKGKVLERSFEAGPWKITVRKSHILRSSCERGDEEDCSVKDSCHVCRYKRELHSLPALPEMIFPDSWLRLDHVTGCGLEFNALEALKRVDTKGHSLKVANAEDWSKSRGESLSKVKGVVQPYDWTYSTDYRGSLYSSPQASIQEEETSDGIDYNLLKQKEKIYFYDEIILYEDELADNGTTVLSIKIRVMDSGFYLLMRFFLRVDGVLVRLHDTRIHHKAGSNYLTREYCCKETKITDMRLPTSALTDPDIINNILSPNNTTIHKLIIPKID